MKNNKDAPTLHILLADDDKDDRFFFERALKELPLSTDLEMVADGERLMDHLNKNLPDLPDILFLDLNMPRKNGSECLKEIKSNELLKKIPIILCSTSLGDDFANALYQDGAHYYLHKCDYAELKKCIHMAIMLVQNNKLQPSRDQFMLGLQIA